MNGMTYESYIKSLKLLDDAKVRFHSIAPVSIVSEPCIRYVAYLACSTFVVRAAYISKLYLVLNRFYVYVACIYMIYDLNRLAFTYCCRYMIDDILDV